MNRLVAISLSASLLGACSTVPERHVDDGSLNEEGNTTSVIAAPARDQNNINEAVDDQLMGEDQLLFYLLRREFFRWQGTPYRLGGNNKKGIDCSALVQHIYRDSFNIHLPRTTKTQVKKGLLVYRHQLQIGDLVFFKTGRDTRHVGIYIGNNQFIHASTSKGVITSSLDNIYWKPKYWQAKRILN